MGVEDSGGGGGGEWGWRWWTVGVEVVEVGVEAALTWPVSVQVPPSRLQVTLDLLQSEAQLRAAGGPAADRPPPPVRTDLRTTVDPVT